MNGGDGASSCPADGRSWNHPITVWRAHAFEAEDTRNVAALTSCPPTVWPCTNSYALPLIGTPNSTLSGRATRIQCATSGVDSNGSPASVCSGGFRVGNIDATSGVTLNFVHSAAGGTQSVVVYYANGDASANSIRRFNISVNSGAAQNVSFPVVQAGNWNKIAGMTIAVGGFLQGDNNTIRFLGDRTHPGPDLDWIEIMPGPGSTAEAESATVTGQAHAYTGCTTCSAGARVGSFGPNSSAKMGNVVASTAGTHTVVVYYSNGDSAARSMYIKVNGNPATLFSGTFKSTGSWTTVGSVSLTLAGFTAGSANIITFSTGATFSAPDLDFIQVN
jgi:hypothetical protein